MKVNARLPERVTFANNAMNSGAGAEVTSVATKHRDPKTLLGYVIADEGLLMHAALTISNKNK